MDPTASAARINGSLIIRKRQAGPVWYAKWRDSTRTQQLKKLGSAWLSPIDVENPFMEGAEASNGGPRQESWRKDWEQRQGRCPATHLTARDASALMLDHIAGREREIVEQGLDQVDAKQFSDVVDSWLQERRNDVEDQHLKKSTLKDYQSMLRRSDAPVRKRGRKPTAWICNEFDDKLVSDISVEDITAFEEKLKTAGLAQRTRTKYIVVLSMILDHAVETKLIKRNPVADRPKPKRKPRKRSEVPKVYSNKVVEKIAVETDMEIVGEMIRSAAKTGLRQGELLNTRVRNVNFELRTITVEKNWGGADIGEDVPKGGAARTIPLSDQAGEIFKRVLDRDRFTEPHNLIFCNELGSHIDGSTVRREYARGRDRVAEREDIEILTFHDLRHTFGSKCAADGIPLSLIQQWMGHADIQTTMIYIHWVPRHDDADRLTRALNADDR